MNNFHRRRRMRSRFAMLIACTTPLLLLTSKANAQVTGNAVNIPAGADGVTVNNVPGGRIISDATAVNTEANTDINNGGTIQGTVNGVNFANGLGSGNLTNTSTGEVLSDSRAVNIGGQVNVSNSGAILGTGNQRNGTIYSDSSANNFNINNTYSGRIDAGVGNQGAGISTELDAAGTNFTIDNAGTIAGRGSADAGAAIAGDGIRLERTRVGGVLEGSTTGTFTGTINNSGSITSESTNGTTAGLRTVNGVSFQGQLNNTGTISGAQNGLYFGNPTPAGGGDHTGGVVYNQGEISSDSRALNVDGTGLIVNNDGQIIGTGNQRNGTVYADSTAQGFSLNNRAGGLIDAGVGNQGAGFSAELSAAGNNFTIDNAGTIAGRGSADAGVAIAGDGIRLERTRAGGTLDGSTTGTFNGTINNSGSITSDSTSGTTAGLRTVNGVSFQGQLNNSGTISGAQNGLYFGNPTPAGGGDHTGGVVNNRGVISSDSRVLNIDGSGLIVNNDGQIIGTGNQRNGTVYADSTAQGFSLNNRAGGLIDTGAGNEGAGFSAELSSAGNDFTIDNAGTIAGRGSADAGAAIAGDGIRLERTRVSGALDGSTTGAFTGTINNSGSITSESTNGTTAGIRAVNGVSFQGQLNNSGTISGAQNGLYFGNPTPAGGGDHTGGVVNNRGVISSDSRALNIDGTGLIVNNDGQVVGTGNQRNGTVYADSTAQGFTLNNRGSIDAGAGNSGAAFSVELSQAGNDFTINNSGSLQGRGNASAGSGAAGDGIRLERSRVNGALDGSTTGAFTGVINNSGRINSESNNGTTAGFRAVNGTSFQGTLNNSGEISGTQNGVYFGNAVTAGGADHTGGVVNNTGTISSDSRAFNIDGTGLTLNNRGSIAATGRQRNGTVYVDGTASDFTINNQEGGSIDARGGAGSGVSIQVGSSPTSVQAGIVRNAGQIFGQGDALQGSDAIDAGIRLFTNDPGATFQGDIINEVGGLISADTTPAVLVQTGVNLDGTVFNAGTIDGGISLASGNLVLEDTSELILGFEDGWNEFETVEVAGDITFGGVLELDFVGNDPLAVGQVLDLFDFSSASGEFSSIAAAGVEFDTSELQSTGSLRVSSLTAVPEPGSLSALLAATVLLMRRRRRRPMVS
ncbi:MAG: PEP-CTERM sorting domain-containing protein [Planctomycetota bacterium]